MSYETSSSGVPQPVQNSTSAIISLITGILGLTLLLGIGSIVAVITGMMAKKEIRTAQAGGGTLGGEGMATAGLILGWLGIALGVIACCVIALTVLIPAILALGIYQSSWLLPLIFTI